MGQLAEKRIKNNLPAYEHPKSVHETMVADKAFREVYESHYAIQTRHTNAYSDGEIRLLSDVMWSIVTRAVDSAGEKRFKSRLKKLLHVKPSATVASADLEYYLRQVRDRLKLSKKLGLPSKLEQAMDVIVEELRVSPDYFRSWQANIAVEFQDQFAKFKKRGKPNRSDVHFLSNRAAENFLIRLLAIKGDYDNGAPTDIEIEFATARDEDLCATHADDPSAQSSGGTKWCA